MDRIDPTPSKHPLYVDLDGTLIRSDSLQQASLMLLRRNPPAALRALWALKSSRTKAKAIVAHGINLDPAHLPYRPEVLDYIHRAKAEGRRVVLATGSTRKYAEAVAKHVGLFDAVFATETDGLNLISKNKLDRILADCGGQPFEYLGDSHADLVVFEGSAVAGWVGGRRLKVVAKDSMQVHRLAPARNDSPVDLIRLLRPHQWAKNLLVGLPLLTAQQWNNNQAVVATLMAAIALCFVASASYVLNDLLDIDADQQHAQKRRRPIASGAVTLSRAIPLAAVLLVLGFVLAAMINWQTALTLGVYVAVSTAYSFSIKRQFFVGALALTALLLLRPLLGAAATGVSLSPVVITICILCFGGVAFWKRYAESRATIALMLLATAALAGPRGI